MIASPPVSEGAVQEKATCVLLVFALSLVKAVGSLGTVAATIEKADVRSPIPIVFLAWTLKLYVAPAVRLVLV